MKSREDVVASKSRDGHECFDGFDGVICGEMRLLSVVAEHASR